MAGHILELRGCTPEPLGNYLKGLGVFRLIAEQADPQARAWWKQPPRKLVKKRKTPSFPQMFGPSCSLHAPRGGLKSRTQTSS